MNDEKIYDELQLKLLGYILEDIREGLTEALPNKDLFEIEELSEKIGFAITNRLDGTTKKGLMIEECRYVPKISFIFDVKDDKSREIDVGGSWMHEYVFGYFDGLCCTIQT